MDTYILGAGASKSYLNKDNNCSMPLAKEVFKTFNKLSISENPQVLIGDIFNYLRDNYGFNEYDFCNYNEDIEVIHSEIHTKLLHILNNIRLTEGIQVYRAHQQLVFLFVSIINEIQNGPSSIVHKRLANVFKKDDCIVTFNWDTLIDRSLFEVRNWKTDNGYGFIPKGIYNDGWREPDHFNENNLKVIKLHGSTNWLVGHFAIDKNKLIPNQALPYNNIHIFESSTSRYPTYRGRYWDGYKPFSYGYYPVNLPIMNKPAKSGKVNVRIYPGYDSRIVDNSEFESGIPAMPVIIPPIKEKQYDMFGDLFEKLWFDAEKAIEKSNRIFIIGYSFPVTDLKARELFLKAFCKRKSMPQIIIINPHTEQIEKMFLNLGIHNNHLKLYQTYFDENFDFSCFE